MSYLDISSPVYFLIKAETFSTASFAISPNLPVATTFPLSLDCAGVTSATIGIIIPAISEIPEFAPITANPFTIPISEPSIE